jgi:lipopolysaccharide biosynthesis glycosyltransferase
VSVAILEAGLVLLSLPHNFTHRIYMKTVPQYVFITDSNFLRPTLLSLWSLLKNSSFSSPVVNFWGNQLTESDWVSVDRILATCPNAKLQKLDLDVNEMQGAAGPSASSHVTAATMARLLIPSKLGGRVLYVDGDTIVTSDLSEIFETDMKGFSIGAVRDIVMTKRYLRGSQNKEATLKKMEECAALIGKPTIGDYVNAGILLIDTDAIRDKPDVQLKMEDIAHASTLPYGDQDHLNHVFRDNFYYLHPAWNASWGRVKEQKELIFRNEGYPSELGDTEAKIIHFHGPKKPWIVSRLDFWTAKGRAVMSYRKEMRRYAKLFPDLVP